MSVRFISPAWASCGNLAGTGRLSKETTIILGPKQQSEIVRFPHDHRAVLVRGSCDGNPMCLRATGLHFFSNLSL